jgi:hypothetical protein
MTKENEYTRFTCYSCKRIILGDMPNKQINGLLYCKECADKL